MLSHIPHALIWTGFCLLPLLIWLPLWLLDAGREPSNEIRHESADDGTGRERDPDPPLLAAAALAETRHDGR